MTIVHKSLLFGLFIILVSFGLFACSDLDKSIKQNRMVGHTFYFYGEVESMMDEKLSKFLKEQKGNVYIEISSLGGYSYALRNMFENILAYDKGEVIGKINADADSAAAMIMCSMDKIEIKDSAYIMFHLPQSNMGPVTDPNHLENKRYRELMQYCIKKHIVTQEEYEATLRGEEVWIKGSEINKRLEKK